MRARTVLAVIAALALIIGIPVVMKFSSGGQSQDSEIQGLRIMVPTEPGGGYDTTARSAAKVMEEAKLNSNVEVFNVPGAGGTIGLGRTAAENGNGKLALQMGLGVVGASYTNKSPVQLKDTTPIAKLTEEPDIIVVPKSSQYQDIKQLVQDWKANPGGLPVGGGSSPGGPDHLAPMLTAKAAGLEPKAVNYVPFDGGGELLASLLGGKVAFGVTGIGEVRDQIDAGELRVLAVTSAQRAAGVNAPTLKESGIDVEFTNWRGVVAPPGLNDADREKLVSLYTKLNESPQWQDTLKRNGWTNAFQSGDEFAKFMQSENDRVASVLKELGLA
ncbi:tripartite tricarboxylate transporter substrate binding protein [Saccharopolyspora sp. S2-29]|uniref:Tripartite tricarboxylate transporter substrate binding protein n=2 Tax=Saccharopolyspora mangrovi TaxID=3082379 RepID=A0ABU6AHK0_9PSEU|nr:tripartite tricarboxylate transporter substrate binding protein [Saccharopolyspora sp. S2-29]MEB3371049.1 tripartite tricarboxylate transporter substrate binding protein [Saccharopolyspora sp. S2-29]